MQAAAGRRAATGFTLVELIVALAIASLLLALAPAALDRLYEGMQYRSAVREVLAALQAARTRAQVSGQAVDFHVDPGGGGYGFDGAPVRRMPERISLRALGTGAAAGLTIRFYPDGSASGGELELLRPGGDGVRLQVDWLLGRVVQARVAG